MARTYRFDKAIGILDGGLGSQHDGYQLYVSLHGEPLLDHAAGTRQPGLPMSTETPMLWFSSTKPLTAMAIGQLFERGKLHLDDRVIRYIPEFQNGKETATIRHLLTHQGGFPSAQDGVSPRPWDEVVAQICAAVAEWEPGTAAGYHGSSGHTILGEIVHRIDGRPIERYMREEILDPLEMRQSYLAIPADLVPVLRDQVSHVFQKFEGGMSVPGFDDRNADWCLSAVSPGNNGRGPAHDLGKFYEALLGGGVRKGVRVLRPETVEALIACHRRRMVDRTFAASGMFAHPHWGFELPWGLSFMLDGNVDVGTQNSLRVFGHSGALSSVGFADPESGLACVIITNGLLEGNANAHRLGSVADEVNRAIRGSS